MTQGGENDRMLIFGWTIILTDYSNIFFMFLKEVSYDHQGYIYLIKNTVK